ncbi:glycosyltransferase family 1 protein [Rickenella mellea]|uniref:Glycosyltransferase family 1 protein n=1 Tax=Rickenella mellea TaxID=50990 RepID=A0A4Y7QMH4_9AGAM|nr:glycosyltransferase family 1 protein [Rickenella mellea]
MASDTHSPPLYMRDEEIHESTVSDEVEVELGSIQTRPNINYAEYKASGKGLDSFARMTDDGRIVITLNLKQKLPDLPKDYAKTVKEFAVDPKTFDLPPKINIVIMIVGSRGDVQPFLALGKRLVSHGHRVRIATHNTFRSFVKDADLEFFNIGGDPQELMSYMVKNPGLVPGFDSLVNGDIGRKRKMLGEMLDGCWTACYEPDEDSGKAFAADAIISNPPTFAHVHCAEALGIPLLLSFTMPWCPTTSFPHPLVNIKQSNAKRGLTNYLSYSLVDLLTWQGMGDIVDRFRTRTLGLAPLSLRSGPGVVDRLKIPWTYCMSPALVPKPDDWTNHIDVVGFYFLELSANYKPPQELEKFLTAGPPPIYIGFGSVVVSDPKAMTDIILKAVKRAGVRALVSAGWGGIGGAILADKDVFILGNVPHDWLFDRVSAVCHHGGAGTTAIGLRMGKPTIIVPFFGDQPFWGMMVHDAGAGPAPIPQKELSEDNLTDAIKFTLRPEAQAAAKRMGQEIRNEDGVANGASSFYKHLPLLNMRCDLDPSRVAVWWSTKHCLKLSAFAAQTLADARIINLKDLDLHRPKEYDVLRAVSDPFTGGGAAIFWTVTHYYAGIAEIFYQPVKGIIHTTTAIPRGVYKIVASIHEGLHNVPKLYGSKVRDTGKVEDFESGMKKAGKDFFYGYYDGITGLLTEPMQGAKKEGFMGAIKGSARSFVNVTVRPAAGIVGLVANPLQGVWKSMQKGWAQKHEPKQRATRISDGVEDVKSSSREARNAVMRKFKDMEATSAERKSQYATAAVEALSAGKDEPQTMAETQISAPADVPIQPAQPRRSSSEHNESFERDLAIAKQRSMDRRV